MLRQHFTASLDPDALAYLTPKLEWMGKQAVVDMDTLSLTANRERPRLIKRNRW